MDKKTHSDNQYEANQELRTIDDTYVFDASTGLYKPKSHDGASQSRDESTGRGPRTPLFVHTVTDWRPVIVSAIISIATLAIICAYTWITQGIYETTQASAAGTIQAAWAARDSADRAKVAIEDARKSFADEQRAWIGVAPMPLDTATKPPQITVYVVNSGRTPAFNVRQTPDESLEPNGVCCGLSVALAYHKPSTKETSSKGTIPPGIPLVSAVYPISILGMDVVSVVQHSRIIRVMSGHITYEDAFQRKHFTNYCFYFSANIPFTPSSARTNFCPYGNDTDEHPQPLPKDGTMIDYP